MNILYNNEVIELPDINPTVESLAKLKNVPQQGAAIAVNDKLIKKELWPVTILKPLDRVVVITAAFGG